MADFTIEMFRLTGEERREMEIILTSVGGVHRERGLEHSPSRETWSPDWKGRASPAADPLAFSFWENCKIAAGNKMRGVQISSSHLSYSIWQKPTVTQNEKPKI